MLAGVLLNSHSCIWAISEKIQTRVLKKDKSIWKLQWSIKKEVEIPGVFRKTHGISLGFGFWPLKWAIPEKN